MPLFFVMGLLMMPLFGFGQYFICTEKLKPLWQCIPFVVVLIITLAVIISDLGGLLDTSGSYIDLTGFVSHLALGFFTVPSLGGLLIGWILSRKKKK